MCRLAVSRGQLFEPIERPALQTLPATEYAYAEWRLARVGLDYHVDIGLGKADTRLNLGLVTGFARPCGQDADPVMRRHPRINGAALGADYHCSRRAKQHAHPDRFASSLWLSQ